MSRSFIILPLIALVLVSSNARARTWHVPSECPTIQAGIDSASARDTVLVACGTYYECGHEDPWGSPCCVLMKSGVCLHSETGHPDCATIDAQYCGRAIACEGVDSTTTIVGFTITRGFWDLGGGIWCYESSPRMRNCVFVENQAYHGGALACSESRPILTDCVFADNYAEFGGGAIDCAESSFVTLVRCQFMRNAGGAIVSSSSSIEVTECLFAGNFFHNGGGAVTCGQSVGVFAGCTFYGNSSADAGSAIQSIGGSTIGITNSIIASGTSWAPPVFCGNDGSTVTMTCCDVFGNTGGDWVGCVADQHGVNGNLSLDPLFCDPENDDFSVDVSSPCADGNHPDGYPCGLIGALDVGCDVSRVERATWSGVKAIYRDMTP